MPMYSRSVLVTALLSVGLLAACATSPRVDQTLGAAVAAAIGRQTIHPESAVQATLVLDGPAADAAVKRYFQSYAAPPAAADTLSIGVSRGGTGSRP